MGNRPHRDEGEGEAGTPGLSLTRYHTSLRCAIPSHSAISAAFATQGGVPRLRCPWAVLFDRFAVPEMRNFKTRKRG